MSNAINILCPGQGAQVVGMGKDIYESSAAARKVFDRANEVVGFDLSAICFNGPEDRLNQTDISQPALYACGVASFVAARETGALKDVSPTAYAGLSLGEYTALHLGGAFSFDDGLRLVAARGRYMQEAAVASKGAMVAIMGADEEAVKTLCQQNAENEVLVPANYNAPGQIVVSGSQAACQRITAAAETGGFKAIALKVAGAFHSPLMQTAADRMKQELDRVAMRSPGVTVYSNVTARPHEDVDSIKQSLVDQIVQPVRWEQTMKLLLDAGEARYVELAPGRTLAGLLKRMNRRLPVESLATTEGLAKA